MSGNLSALRELPMIVYLLRPGAQHKINVSKLLQVLKPKVSEEGSNAFSYETMAYHMFVRYVREVPASRRVHYTMTLTFYSSQRLQQRNQCLALYFPHQSSFYHLMKVLKLKKMDKHQSSLVFCYPVTHAAIF
jgi:hypothetical protein